MTDNPPILNEHKIVTEEKTVQNCGKIKLQKTVSGGGSMDKYVSKDTFEQFEKRMDTKLDSLSDRMADKIDARISDLEAKQTKWFVGVGIGLIGVLLKIFGVI